MRKFYISLLCLLLCNAVQATVFTVVSPLDNPNPGTLRWALQQAAANGTTTQDTIVFAIPSVAQNTHVIVLNSELPFLTSNLVIDGTTQAGTPFGLGDSKIAITPAVFQNCKRGFVIKDASNVEIYGFLFAGFINSNPTVNETYSDAIYMFNVTNVRIGRFTKGNSFTGDFWAIRHEAVPSDPRNPPPVGMGSNIIIQSNTIGKNQTGRVLSSEGVVNGISLFDCNNVTIGGQTDEENTFMVFLNGIRVGLKATNITDTSIVKILGNKFDPATSTPPLPIQLPILGIEVNDNDVAAPGLHLTEISNNDIEKYTTGITLGGLKHPFIIANNIINLDRRNNLFPSSLGIGIAGCDSGKIGGINAANFIHDIKNFGITVASSKYITISRNVIYCTPKGILITSPSTVIPQITDLIIDVNQVAIGKTCNNCKVEVFNTNACNTEIYNGQTYQATLLADNTGNFSYNGPLSCNTTFTTTSTAGATSEFYTPYQFIMDTTMLVVTDASCGRNNGSITGVRIFSGVNFTWEDMAGNVVGVDTNLVNVGPGFYRLVGIKQNIGCTLATQFFEIKNVQPVIDLSNIQIIQPSDCGGLGSIKNINVLGGPPSIFRYKWTDINNAIVGNSLNLLNVGPGTYKLTVSMISDSTCFTSAGPFVLVNLPAPYIDSSAIQITDATCGKSNGMITGFVIHNQVGSQKFIWKNFQGNVVGNSITLSNVPAGRYKLLYKDDAPCDTLRTGYFIIRNFGLITIDESSKIIRPSGCTVINGSITNIIVTGATSVQWINVLDNSVVGNSPNLGNVPTGDYRLIAYDIVNSCVDSTTIIHIPTTVIQPVSIVNKQIGDETCSSANGFIQVNGISPSIGYTYTWVKNSTDTFSTSLSISHLTAGTYTLIAIDQNGCSQTVFQQIIIDHPAPQLNTRAARIISDTCTQSIGSIRGISITGGEQPFSYKWYDGSNQLVASLPDLVNRGLGDYYFIATDNNGCADTTTVFHINDIIPLIPTPQYDDLYAKRYTSILLKVKNPASGIYHMFEDIGAITQYDQNSTGNFITPILRNDIDYYINLQVGACYSPLTKVHITVIDFSKIFVPNSFTPNNDNLNDIFSIKVFGKITIDYLEIYNRWGKRVFRTKDITQGWDGKTGNSDDPPGAYVWILQGYDVDGSVLNLRGSVLLIR